RPGRRITDTSPARSSLANPREAADRLIPLFLNRESDSATSLLRFSPIWNQISTPTCRALPDRAAAALSHIIGTGPLRKGSPLLRAAGLRPSRGRIGWPGGNRKRSRLISSPIFLDTYR